MDLTVKVPSGWHDVTLEQWMNLVAIKGTDTNAIAERIAVLSGIDIEDVMRLNTQSFERLTMSLTWIGQPIPSDLKEELEIDGVKYKLVTDISKLELGCCIDLENYIEKSATDNLHLILASLYRREGVVYSGTDFELAEKLMSQPISMVNGASLFFSLVGKNCATIIQSYLDKQEKLTMNP